MSNFDSFSYKQRVFKSFHFIQLLLLPHLQRGAMFCLLYLCTIEIILFLILLLHVGMSAHRDQLLFGFNSRFPSTWEYSFIQMGYNKHVSGFISPLHFSKQRNMQRTGYYCPLQLYSIQFMNKRKKQTVLLHFVEPDLNVTACLNSSQLRNAAKERIFAGVYSLMS